MAHWRDGGIGNMPGSDDRPIEEWTLLEKLADIASTPVGNPMPRALNLQPGDYDDWATPIKNIAQEAFDEIQRLRGPHPVEIDWQPIDTAPVEPGHTVPNYYRFRCLLQDAHGEVFEGAAYYVKVGFATVHLSLRWQNARQHQCFPKFWKPLPLPKKTESGAIA